MEFVSGLHVKRERAQRRLQERCRTADQARQRRAFELESFVCVGFALPVKRKMVGVLADQHMGQQARCGQTPCNGSTGRICLNNGLALCANIFRSRMTDHLEARRHDVQHLGHVLAKQSQRAIAARAGAPFDVGRLVHERLAGQASGQGFAGRTFARTFGLFGCTGRVVGTDRCAFAFELLDKQLDLRHLRQALEADPKLCPLVLKDLQLEFFHTHARFKQISLAAH